MINEIKAIDTFYNGNYFRSRLEARWAVFFDIIRVKYYYEHEGYKLKYNDCVYLPDFYLPQYDEFIELKHRGLVVDDFLRAKSKCIELSMMLNKNVWLTCGDPLDHLSYMFLKGLGVEEFSGVRMEFFKDRFGICPTHKKGYIQHREHPKCEDYSCNCPTHDNAYIHLEEATQAIMTRFEHK